MKKFIPLLFPILSLGFFLSIFIILLTQENYNSIDNYGKKKNNDEDIELKKIKYIDYKFLEGYIKNKYEQESSKKEIELKKLREESEELITSLQNEDDYTENAFNEFYNNFINKYYNWTCNGFIVFITIFGFVYLSLYLLYSVLERKISEYNNKSFLKKLFYFIPKNINENSMFLIRFFILIMFILTAYFFDKDNGDDEESFIIEEGFRGRGGRGGGGRGRGGRGGGGNSSSPSSKPSSSPSSAPSTIWKYSNKPWRTKGTKEGNEVKNNKKRCIGFVPGMIFYAYFIILSFFWLIHEIKKIKNDPKKQQNCRGKVIK